MKVRKRPLVVDAEDVGALLALASRAWASMPDWVREADRSGRLVFGRDLVFIQTAHGHVSARAGDYLIRGTEGEIYACEGLTFGIIYEVIEGG